jgi:starvation-inducible DNA-binding protein
MRRSMLGFNLIMKTETTTTAETAVVEGLQTLLADSYALMGQTHLAHWNVEGPAFFELHGAFQKQYEELFTAIDDIAERLRALDVMAPGGLKLLAEKSRISEMTPGAAPAKDFVAHLIDSHETLVANALVLRESAGEANDLQTQDMVIGRISTHEKTLWMLRSYLKNL